MSKETEQKHPATINGKKAGTYKANNGNTYSIIGMTLMELQVISDEVEAEWKKKGYDLPEPPMQRLAPQFGAPDKYFYIPFTENTIQTDGTEYDKKLWDAYQHALKDYNKLSSKRMLYAIISRLIIPQKELEEFFEDRKQMTRSELRLPEDELAIKQSFIEVNILGARTEDEMIETISSLLAQALKTAGVITDAEVDKITNLFRDKGQITRSAIDGADDTAEA